MSNEITIFSNNLFGDVRTLIIDDEPWFIAKDICCVLDLSNVTRAIERLDEDEKGFTTIQTLGGPQNVNIINESGMYALVLSSRKPDAKDFSRWVRKEVLPSIRKTGSYTMPTPIDPVRALEALGKPRPPETNPNLWQMLQDRLQNDLMGTTQALPAPVEWLGVVEICRRAGITIPRGYEGAAGKTVFTGAKLCGIESITQDRIVNGEMRPVRCYHRDHWDFVVATVKGYLKPAHAE